MKYRSCTYNQAISVLILIWSLSPLAIAQVLKKPQSSELFIVADGQQHPVTNEEEIRHYLGAHTREYGWIAPDHDLLLVNIKTSLTAKHYHFQQLLNHIPIDRAEIIVSVGLHDHKIQKIYNSLAQIPVTQIPQLAIGSKPRLNKDEALQLIWSSKPRHSRLIAKPAQRLVYANHQGRYQLVYRISVPVDKEEGHWEYTVDALTGQILVAERLDTPAKPSADFQHFRLPKSLHYNNAGTSLAQELKRFETMQSLKMSSVQKMMRVNGSGYVFNPDPRTALHNADLQHDSSIEAFENAYVQKALLDIKQVGDQYFLDGPWVSIQELEKPEDAPATTTDGNWVAKRLDDGFLDVMVYFHLDQSQRYLQSLGFVGEKAIQDGPIAADSNGIDGVQNAYYMPGLNQIVFGKANGCPPMAEDADIILHEYGHAIQRDINPNWYGGDTGAIGEGFSDYWAGSYSIATQQGATFHPERFAHWAGFNSCFEGRVLNRTDIRYRTFQVYKAHERIDDYWSDELWSAPLFQALLTLIEMGIPHEQVDTIILESHFGLGADINMRDMALATVVAANALYPDGPHARVFREKFEDMNILPSPLSIDSLKMIGGGVQQLLLPGGQLGVYTRVKNSSWKTPLLADLKIADISGNLETITDPVKSISVDSGSLQRTEFSIQVKNDAECGSLIDMQYEFLYQDPDTEQPTSTIKNVTSLVGAPVTQEFMSTPDAMITSGDNQIHEFELEVDGLPILPQYFQVYVDIRYDLFSPPKLVVRSPSGVRVPLSISSDLRDKVKGYFPDSMQYSSLFEAFSGEESKGTWVLEVSNPWEFERSIVKQWGIKTWVSADCNMSPDQGDFTVASIKASTSGAEQLDQFTVNPGDTVDLKVRVTNESSDAINGISMNMLTNENFPLEIPTHSQEMLSPLADMEANFRFALPDTYECETSLLFNMTSNFKVNGEEKQIITPIEFYTGQSLTHEAYTYVIDKIPDNDPTGLVRSLYVDNMMPIDLDNFSVFLDIDHPSTSDLNIILRSPEGQEVVLVANDYDNTVIYGSFPDDYQVSGDMSVLSGRNPNGTWTLTIQDTRLDNAGTLFYWAIKGSAGVSCNSSFNNQHPEAQLISDNFFINEGDSIILDASLSTDDDVDSLKFTWTKMEGPDASLSSTTGARVQFTAPQVYELTYFVYKVEITDYFGNTDSAEVIISVRDRMASSNASSRRSGSTGGGGGGVSVWLLVALLLFGMRYGFYSLVSKNN